MIEQWLYNMFAASICLTLCYSVYGLFLKHETFHQWNRIYLAVTLGLCLIISWSRISVPVESARAQRLHHLPYFAKSLISGDESVLPALVREHLKKQVLDQDVPSRMNLFTPGTLLFFIYILGVLIFVTQLGGQIARVLHMIGTGTRRTINGLAVVEVDAPVGPCCFGPIILINPERIPKGSLPTVLHHEAIHVRHGHALDSLLAEVARILMWFCPVAWWYRGAIRMVHEYSADAETTRFHTEPSVYRALLLEQLAHPLSLQPVLGIGLKPVKQRIAMLERLKSPSYAHWKVLYGIPTVVLLFVLFSLHITAYHGSAEGIMIPENAILLTPVVDLFNHPQRWTRTANQVQGPGPHSDLIMHFLQMRAAGWNDIDLDEIAVISGSSALYAYEPGEFMPKYAYLHNHPADRIAAATGFGYQWMTVDSEEEAWQQIKSALDQGKPVKGEYYEDILFVGYREADNAGDRRIYALCDEPDTFSRWFTWTEFTRWFREHSRGRLGMHTQYVPASSPSAVARRTIQDLIQYSDNPPAACQVAYARATFGLNGMRVYANDCSDLKRYKRFAMCHDMNSQWPTRKSTAVYLRRLAQKEMFEEAVNGYLRTAAQHYEQAYQAWCRAFKHIGWDAPRDAESNPSHRRIAAEAVKQAAEQEGMAIASLQRVTALW